MGKGSRIAAAVMAKLPRPGEVKTRLSPPLSADQAAALARALLDDSLAVLRATPGLAPAFAVAGDPAAAATIAGPGVAVVAQRGEGLADRITNAAADLLAEHAAVLLFGADTLGIGPDDLTRAATLLAAPGDRVVLGPSADGGYWLVGLKRAHAALFADMTWSHDGVLAMQLAACAHHGVPVAFTARRADCDAPEDLARAAIEGGPATRAWIAAWRSGATSRGRP